MKVKAVSSDTLIPLLLNLIEQGQQVRLTVTGKSMRPFLRNEIDSVLLEKKPFSDIRIGDIILIRRDSGEYVLHRVVDKLDGYVYIAGDAQDWFEGPIYKETVLAVACAVYRRDKKITNDNNILWKVMIWLWVRTFAVRK